MPATDVPQEVAHDVEISKLDGAGPDIDGYRFAELVDHLVEVIRLEHDQEHTAAPVLWREQTICATWKLWGSFLGSSLWPINWSRPYTMSTIVDKPAPPRLGLSVLAQRSAPRKDPRGRTNREGPGRGRHTNGNQPRHNWRHSVALVHAQARGGVCL